MKNKKKKKKNVSLIIHSDLNILKEDFLKQLFFFVLLEITTLDNTIVKNVNVEQSLTESIYSYGLSSCF